MQNEDRISYSANEFSKSFSLYEEGREAMGRSDFKGAYDLFQKSIAIYPHFKTLELLGECCLKLGLVRESIVPLAAASTLNKGIRAPSLLAEAFLRIDEHANAGAMAEMVLSRSPHNRKALSVKASIETIK